MEEDILPITSLLIKKLKEDEFEWIDLTELAAEKYPHLEDTYE